MQINMAVQQVQQGMTLEKLMQSNLLGGMQGGGGFMDLILQLLAGGQDGENGDVLQMLDGLSTSDDSEDKDKSAQDLLMQMLGGMMAADSLFVDPQLLMQMQLSPETAKLAEVLANTKNGGWQQMALDVGANRQEEEQQDAVFEIVETPQQGAPGQKQGGGAQDLFWTGKFQSSVNEAQKLMRGAKDTDPSQVDVDALQGDVSSGRFAPVNAKAELPLPQAKDVAEQVRTGLLENIGKGKNEFVVKLKPEGLGEITVHMAENGGKLALSIIASSSQTARLINAELAGLRDSLRPYNADVHEVVSQQQYAGEQAAQYHQPGQEQQHQWNQRQHRSQESFGEFLGSDEEEQEAVPAGVYV